MKMDITISRDMTINTGNYGNIKPSISLTLKDFNAGNLSEANNKISDVLDSIMGIEIMKMIDEDTAMKDMGIKEYYKHLLSCKDTMENSIEEFTKELS